MSVAFSQSTVLPSAQIQSTIPHVSPPQSILPINQPVDQSIKHATEHATGHATENSIEYATIQPNEHQSKWQRFLTQSARRFSRILPKNEEFEKTFEPQFLRYQPNSRNDVRYQFNSRNDVRSRNEVKYQPDFRNNRYQPNSRNEVRSNRDRNETENDRYNSKSQDAKKQKFYYENIYQQQPSSHSAVESMHQSMHSFPPKISVRSHTPQIQSIKKSIFQFSKFQNSSFHRATDQSGILPEISQPRYVFAAPPAPTYVSATDNASAYAFTNAPAYISVYAPGNAPTYAFIYAPVYASAYASAAGYEPATDYASKSESTSASTRASRSETTVLD